MSDNLIPSEKYAIFESNLAVHYNDPHFNEEVTNLIKSKQITRDNYRDFHRYDNQLTCLAIDIQEAYVHLNNDFTKSFAGIFQDPLKANVVLSQIARLDNKSLEQVRDMEYSKKMKKGITMMLKEMILASIETKLNVNLY